MQRFLPIPVAVVLSLCAACGNRVTDRNLEKVGADMTTKEVESILGAPTRVESAPELKTPKVVTFPVTRYVYEQNGKTVTLTFVGDRLATGGVQGSFEH